MTNRRQTFAPDGVVRALGLWVLLAGVLLMHIIVFAPGHSMHAGHVAAQQITTLAAADDAAMPMAAHSDSAVPPTGDVRVISPTRPSPVSPFAGPPSMPTAQPGTASVFSDAYAPVPNVSQAMSNASRAIPDSPAATAIASRAQAMAGMDAAHGCDRGGCAMPGMMHACVFILTVLTLLLGLALLGRISGRTDGSARPAPLWPSRRARPPPWTMPSLAELSILRI